MDATGRDGTGGHWTNDLKCRTQQVCIPGRDGPNLEPGRKEGACPSPAQAPARSSALQRPPRATPSPVSPDWQCLVSPLESSSSSPSCPPHSRIRPPSALPAWHCGRRGAAHAAHVRASALLLQGCQLERCVEFIGNFALLASRGPGVALPVAAGAAAPRLMQCGQLLNGKHAGATLEPAGWCRNSRELGWQPCCIAGSGVDTCEAASDCEWRPIRALFRRTRWGGGGSPAMHCTFSTCTRQPPRRPVRPSPTPASRSKSLNFKGQASLSEGSVFTVHWLPCRGAVLCANERGADNVLIGGGVWRGLVAKVRRWAAAPQEHDYLARATAQYLLRVNLKRTRKEKSVGAARSRPPNTAVRQYRCGAAAPYRRAESWAQCEGKIKRQNIALLI